MIEDPINVVIGGENYLCPPMSFYCLERAWPHIQRLGRMAVLNQAVQQAQRALGNATSDAEAASAQAALDAAQARAEGADFIGQTHAALEVIVAALSLRQPPPTLEALAKRLRPEEFAGIHQACTLLMDASGLVGRTPPGESAAMSQTPVPLNGTGSSLSLQPTG